MKSLRISILGVVAAVFSIATASFAQAPANAPNPGKYGLTSWAINNQRVASQYNYYINSTFQTALGGTFTFPSKVCAATLNFGANRNVGAFNSNASVKIIDVNPSNTETVSGVTPTYSGSTCSLPFSTSNTHTAGSYILRSGTCGLREALNDLQSLGGEVIVDQRFYDDGCSASTITGLTFSSTTPPLTTQFIHDISNGQDTWYAIQPVLTSSVISAPTTSANLTCATTAGLVCQSATTGGTWPNSAEYVGEFYVDAMGEWSASSTTANLTPSASGTNVLQFNSPAAATGAVGWLPFGGTTYNSASYVLPVTATNCTLSTAFTLYPVCAIGANATITAPSTTGPLNPQTTPIAAAYNPNPNSHQTFAYAPIRPGYVFQANYGQFGACPTLTAGQLCVVGTVPLPTGILNSAGASFHISGRATATQSTAGTASGVEVMIGDITDFSSGTPKAVCTPTVITSSGTVANAYHFDCVGLITASGTTGKIVPDDFEAAPYGAGSSTGTGSVTADVQDWDLLYLVFVQTSGAENTTPPQLQALRLEVQQN